VGFRQAFQIADIPNPYPHQIQTFEALQEGRPVLLVAPTGSGKSEAVFVPFLTLRSKSLPSRLIYSLPMRALVNDLHRRFSSMVQRNSPVRVAAQHGKRPESVLFYADAVVATLDQVISSYACCPLTLGPRHGNIPAGAVATSFIVFDEVHTYDPERGLQSSLTLAQRLHRMGFPFVFMTATLPKKARDALKERFPRLKEIVAEEADIPVRAQRQVTLEVIPDSLSADLVMDYHGRGKGRTLVVCNTVPRAQELYTHLQTASSTTVHLLHSRFLDEDRDSKDKQLTEAFGKQAPASDVILVATQVVEVGLDISADLLISEVAPVDAVIQRAGRCARWGGKGTLVVSTTVEHTAPYDGELVEATVEELPRVTGDLTWAKERGLVDGILGERYLKLLDIGSASRAMYFLSKAAFYGNSRDAAQAIRENDSVDVSVHPDPEGLGAEARWLPRIPVSKGVLGRFLEERRTVIEELETETADDSHSRLTVRDVSARAEIRLGRFYVISTHDAGYTAETGLVLGEPGQGMVPSVVAKRERPQWARPRLESFAEHAGKAMKYLEEIVIPKEGFALDRLADYVSLPKEDLLTLARIAVLSHDLGKLTEGWQRDAWKYAKEWAVVPGNSELLDNQERELLEKGEGGTFLARFPANRHAPLPAHATVSAYLMADFLQKKWGDWGLAAALAIGHHHVVRAQEVPPHRMADTWLEQLQSLCAAFGHQDIPWEELAKARCQASPTCFPVSMAPLDKEKVYAAYVVLARFVCLADRMGAGGGENAILDYEIWRAHT